MNDAAIAVVTSADGAGGVDAGAVEKLLTSEQVAELIGVSLDHLRQMRQRKQIPFKRLGGGRLIRYSPKALAAWLAEREDH